MARFNKTPVRPSYATRNHEGAVAYSLPAAEELYALAATSLMSDKFYESANSEQVRMRGLIRKCDPAFVAKLAVYCREQMHLRSISGVMVAELSKVVTGELVRKAASRVCQRPDDITEIMAYWATISEKKKGKKDLASFPNALKKGLGDAMTTFDSYQLAKYKQEDKSVTLRDAMFVCHPNPHHCPYNADRIADVTEAFRDLAGKSLPTPLTWETELSAKGNNKATWEGLIESRKMGYMALLRNLRNILNAGVSDDHVGVVCDYLSSEKAVLNSRQFPYRFYAAYKELLDEEKAKRFDRRVLNALEKAAEISARNITFFDKTDRVLVACDTSGSMDPTMSDKSTMHRYEVGLVLGSYLNNVVAQCDSGIFGEDWVLVRLPSENILSSAKTLESFRGKAGHSTNGWKVLDWMIRTGKSYDRVLFFTDCQWWDSAYGLWGSSSHDASKLWAQYKQIVPTATAYYVDLAGYGTTPIRQGKNDVWFVAGWSDRVFDAVRALQDGRKAIDIINEMTL